jgi:hypothetical protein
VRRTIPATLACAALACARPAPAPPAPPASALAPAGTLEVTGLLARKGPSESAAWAVTEPAGRTWLLLEIPPALDARLHALQNRRVTVRIEPAGPSVLDQARLLDVVLPAP